MKHANIALFIPFGGCPQICSFCNQKTIASAAKQPAPEGVSEEIAWALSRLDSGKYRAEIAFFGGSFTALDREYMCRLLEAAGPYLQHPAVTGIRVSTRPDAVDAGMVRLLRDFGVTAIELGAQSMDDRVLRMNRRGHTAADVEKVSQIILDAGVELGLQMMTGLYGDREESALATAEKLIALSPATVRIYPTLVLKGTHLADLLEAGQYRPQTLREAVTLCAKLLDRFEEASVRVIRVGLHDGVSLERDCLAGPYHPAFRELCESERFYRRLCDALTEPSAGERVIRVHPKTISIAVGHGRRNIEQLRKRGIQARFQPDPDVPRGAFRIVR